MVPPLRRAAPLRQVALMHIFWPMQPRAVLLVNDDPDFLEALSGLLEGEGYPVISAQDTGEALERLQYVQPVLIVSDFRAPTSEAPPFLSLLRERGLYDEVPRLILSSESPELVWERMKEASIDAPYLHQLTDLPVLLRAVHDAFEAAANDNESPRGLDA
jgi:CheY-like chemotaxis protein